MINDDVLYGFRLRLFSLAQELGNVRAACRIFGIHPSTYYCWRGPVLRSGLEMLRPRERRPPRMPNQTSQLTEQRVLAFSLGHPGLGPRRISATLAQERSGGIIISPNGVWWVLRRHGLNQRISRLSLVAGYAAPPEPERPAPLERVLSDNGSEFRSSVFGDTIRELGATQTFIRAGRPATNGAVERVQRTILEECWRPSFARSLVPKLPGLTSDLAAYLRFYNEERAHTGRLTARRPCRRSSEPGR